MHPATLRRRQTSPLTHRTSTPDLILGNPNLSTVPASPILDFESRPVTPILRNDSPNPNNGTRPNFRPRSKSTLHPSTGSGTLTSVQSLLESLDLPYNFPITLTNLKNLLLGSVKEVR